MTRQQWPVLRQKLRRASHTFGNDWGILKVSNPSKRYQTKSTTRTHGFITLNRGSLVDKLEEIPLNIHVSRNI